MGRNPIAVARSASQHSRRARAIYRASAHATTGIAGERLFLVAPRLGNESGGAKPAAAGEKPGTPVRVDLALR